MTELDASAWMGITADPDWVIVTPSDISEQDMPRPITVGLYPRWAVVQGTHRVLKLLKFGLVVCRGVPTVSKSSPNGGAQHPIDPLFRVPNVASGSLEGGQ